MSWSCNQGPSFNNVLQTYPKLNGFYQRFNLRQDDNRMTPGKKEPRLPEETTKGTFSMKKANRKQSKQVTPRDNIPKQQPNPIYSGFGAVKNKATNKIRQNKGKIRKRRQK